LGLYHSFCSFHVQLILRSHSVVVTVVAVAAAAVNQPQLQVVVAAVVAVAVAAVNQLQLQSQLQCLHLLRTLQHL